jgi:hypothetical protein
VYWRAATSPNITRQARLQTCKRNWCHDSATVDYLAYWMSSNKRQVKRKLEYPARNAKSSVKPNAACKLEFIVHTLRSLVLGLSLLSFLLTICCYSSRSFYTPLATACNLASSNLVTPLILPTCLSLLLRCEQNLSVAKKGLIWKESDNYNVWQHHYSTFIWNELTTALAYRRSTLAAAKTRRPRISMEPPVTVSRFV